MKKEFRIRRPDDFVVEDLGYLWDVQEWCFINGDWNYAGNGKFCKTLEEAKMYIAERSETA